MPLDPLPKEEILRGLRTEVVMLPHVTSVGHVVVPADVLEKRGCPEIALAVKYTEGGSHRGKVFPLEREDALRLARKILQDLAPSFEDKILASLKRIEDRLPLPQADQIQADRG